MTRIYVPIIIMHHLLIACWHPVCAPANTACVQLSKPRLSKTHSYQEPNEQTNKNIMAQKSAEQFSFETKEGEAQIGK